MIRLLVADDHPIVREGLSSMISAEPDMEVVGMAATGSEAVELYVKDPPDVVLLDLLLPDMDGTEATRQIFAADPNARILVLTTVARDEDIYKVLEAGARGYLFKDMVLSDLIQAIRAVHSGNRYIPSEVAARLAENLPRNQLSAREAEVLQLVAAGFRNKEIGYKLSISEATVNAHVRHIMEKLGASDRTHAVTKALRRGFIRL